MHWFLISLIPPLFWAITNYIDTYLIEKHTKKEGIGALIIFSALIGFIIAPAIFVFNPGVLSIPLFDISILIITGIFGVLWVIFYLYALESDETTIVIPLFQIIPVMTFVLGFFILGETLTINQAIGSMVIVIGGFFLGLNLEKEDGLSFKWKPFILMMISSFFVALNEVLFKLVTVPDSFVISTFWSYVGYIIIGIFLYVLVTPYRIAFNNLVRTNTKTFFGLNAINEVVNTTADITMRFAILLAPVALVQSVNSFQPFYILVIGIFLTKFFPHINEQKIDRKSLIQRIVSIAIIIIGSIIVV